MATEIKPFKIILGSSSLSRREILAEMGYKFTVMPADIDEKSIRKEKPEELVMALAEAKVLLIAGSWEVGLGMALHFGYPQTRTELHAGSSTSTSHQATPFLS
ncbi:dTTP/UTP pyrophosphatase-like [Macadamia integrifolia]|uniref:dTTP/UTP pyrophosphatase-like n=1 Tax=Macadamia integrifolia TaxID=60698 RepID=UPI001C4E57E6|nr:dTTP/UTP pyrophosphatase-like [Macadamia integrifolia]